MSNDSRTLDEILASEARALAEVERLKNLINDPHVGAWTSSVIIEAAHQKERWPAAQDAQKTPEDWFWLVGYLAGKCLAAFKQGDMDKARHHTISTAAVCYQWSKSIDERMPEVETASIDFSTASPDSMFWSMIDPIFDINRFTDGDGTMEVENPPPFTDKRCEGGDTATSGECLHCNAAMGETCRIKDTIK